MELLVRNDTFRKVVVLLWCSLAVASLLAVLGSCGTSQKQIAYQGQATYNASLDILATYREAGYISDKEYENIEVVRKAARSALHEMRFAAEAGNEDLYDIASRMYRVAVKQLMEYVILHERNAQIEKNNKAKLSLSN